MDQVNKIFGLYDKTIAPLSVANQAIISFSVLLFFAWFVFIFLRSKNWIFLAALILILPGTWPATKRIGTIIWTLILGLITRIQGLS